ncbi:MAG TPA: hypothetical protein VGO37_09640 [Steroidobacteraceae bacterium]|nr:hypothetical protein [Steroidobacteraceae bacterium]
MTSSRNAAAKTHADSIQWLPAERLALCAHRWPAKLGDSSLGETLNDLSGVERSSYEHAWLPAVGRA